MSEQEVKNTVEETVVEQAPVETKQDKPDVNEDIFIGEDDTFDIKVRWYKFDGKVMVAREDDEFDEKYEQVNEFTVTFKYPSQGDYEIIIGSSAYRSPEDMTVTNIVQLELARMVTLVRKWSLKQDISRMIELDPNIVKSILRSIREEIGMKGIL